MKVSDNSSGDKEHQLSQALVITRPFYNYVLFAFIISAFIVVIWGLYGSIPQKIEGVGVIATKDGLHELRSMYSGQISQVNNSLKSKIEKGDVVFLIKQPEMESKIREVKVSLNELEQKKELVEKGNSTSTSIKYKADKENLASIKEKMNENVKNISFLEKKVKQNEILLGKGLITKSQFYTIQLELNEAKIESLRLEEELTELKLNSSEWKFAKDLSLNEINSNIELLKQELKDLQYEYKLRTEVKAKTSGTLDQINVKNGDIISTDILLGLISIEDSVTNDLVLNLYIPFSSNEQVFEGMDVDIEPYNVDHNIYGWLKGKVSKVNHVVSSKNSLFNDLENQELESLIESDGPVYKVEVQLLTDSRTESGLKWSNQKGPPYKLYTDQITKGFINVKKKAPVDYLLPIFDDYFK